ncbi:SymE family type I addiction module toxin [Burkholderia sp. PAMC 28687]|uniref:SymE family type I addiction module toxin n=1 Tax=Burkholderia sp. PAMC 28687 TaxID=1795874 RepID=UPI001E60AE18|nr:SymE family type I addiction module toxin [Burkholderia sp. PAMC 28687]
MRFLYLTIWAGSPDWCSGLISSDKAWIKLSGQWIEQAGFLAGQQVRITVEQGKLIITAA